MHPTFSGKWDTSHLLSERSPRGGSRGSDTNGPKWSRRAETSDEVSERCDYLGGTEILLSNHILAVILGSFSIVHKGVVISLSDPTAESQRFPSKMGRVMKKLKPSIPSHFLSIPSQCEKNHNI